MNLLSPERPLDFLGNPCYVGTNIPLCSIGVYTDHGGGVKLGVKIPIAKGWFDYKYKVVNEQVGAFFQQYLEDPEAALISWFNMNPNWHDIEKKLEVTKYPTHPIKYSSIIPKISANEIEF